MKQNILAENMRRFKTKNLNEQMDMFGKGVAKDASGNEYSIIEKNGKFSVLVKTHDGKKIDSTKVIAQASGSYAPYFTFKSAAAKAINDYIRVIDLKAQARKYTKGQARKYTKGFTKQFTRENYD